MPFTLAHPIAAAPIWFCSKRILNLPGLLVGSMIPDIEYFIALKTTKTIGHTFSGIFMQGVPYSIVILFIIRYVLARPLMALLPQRLASRLSTVSSYSPLTFSGSVNIIASIVIGATSHLIWDAFTHESGWFVTRSMWLQSKLGLIPIYKLLQYSSGILGVLALLAWLFLWLDRVETHLPYQTLAPQWKGLAACWIVLCSVVFAGVGIKGYAGTGEAYNQIVTRTIIGCISGLLLGVLLYSIMFWCVRANHLPRLIFSYLKKCTDIARR